VRPCIAGWAIVPTLLAAPAFAGWLTASLPNGHEIARIAVPEGASWCVVWTHSVAGFEVQDCYANRAGRMVLTHSRWPDAAAGLGHSPGRGRMTSDGLGGYVIEAIDEPVPGNAYVLRPEAVGADVGAGHRLRTASREVSLSVLAPRARVTLRLEPAP
jgi:hypothetical protein